MAEITELVVKVSGQGIDKLKKDFGDLETVVLSSTGALDLSSDAIQAVKTSMMGTISTMGVFTKAEQLLAQENKKMEQELREQRKLTWDIAKTLYDMQEAENKKTQEAIRRELESTWRTEMWIHKGREANLKSEARLQKQNAVAANRVAGRPASAFVGRLFGAVGSGDIKEVAQQVDQFRSKMFDLLVVFGAAKAVQAIIVNNFIKPMKWAVDASIEFEKQWAIVTRTVTGSAEELASVREGLRGLMATRPFDPEQITDAARALGELGVSTKEIVKATDYITRFSLASGIATDEAATMIGQILATEGVVRPTAQAIGELASAALDMGTSFAIGNKGVLLTMLRVSALVPTFHLSEEAALGLSTAMGSLGIKAERGTSALQLLFSMARNADSDKLARFANIIGKTAEQTDVLIKTDIGRFTELFVHGLKEMGDAGENTDKLLQDLGVRTVRARQAFGQMAGGADTVSEALNKAEETTGSLTELMDQSDRQLQTTDASIKTLSNSIWVLAGSMTEGLLRPLADTTQGLANLAEAARTMPGPGFWSTLWGGIGGIGSGSDVAEINKSIEQLIKMRDSAELQASGGLMGQSPLVERIKTDTQKAGEFIDDLVAKQMDLMNAEPVPMLDPKRMAEANFREADAARAGEKKAQTELENWVESHYKSSLSAQQKYNEDKANLDKAWANKTITDREKYNQILSGLDKDLADDRKKETKDANKLSETQREINKIIEEARTPMEAYAVLEQHVNELIAEGLPAKTARIFLEKEYKEALKKTNEEANKAAEKQKKLDDELTKYAVSLNPVVELEQQIAKVREAMAKRPGIVTQQVGEEEIARLKRAVKLPEEYEKTMRIVQGITERGMNAVADTMTDALFDGATKGREIMKSFAKDITNILLEELLFKPVSEKIIDIFKDIQIGDYLGKIKQGMPGGGGSTDVAKAADDTTESFKQLGSGAINLLLDLTSGIGAFLSGLLLGQGGEGFSAGGFFKALGIGAAEGAISYYGKGLIPKGTVPDTSHEVPFSSQDGQSSYDPSGGAFGYDTGFSSSRASLMATSGSAMHTGTHGMAPPVNITVTALDPRTASSVIMSNMPVIERGMQRAVDRGAAYAKAHGRRR